jgi:hypothetical protein
MGDANLRCELTVFEAYSRCMSTVESIRTAIKLLSIEERAELTAELCGWTDDDWDRQMKADGAAGKFNSLNRGADAADARGESQPLDDIFHEP